MTNQTTVDSAPVKALVEASRAVAEALRELVVIPDGIFYGTMMGVMDFQTYQIIISTLVRCGLVQRDNNMLRWVGK